MCMHVALKKSDLELELIFKGTFKIMVVGKIAKGSFESDVD